jgi:two-component system sensor histidine kinase KdpD
MTNQAVSRWNFPVLKLRFLAHCLAGFAGLVLLTSYGVAFGAHLSTMSLLYLLLVVAIAVNFGFWPASLTSVVAVACLDYYFTPPIFTFNITDPQDYVELGAFELTALVISRLSARGLRTAKEAAIHLSEMEQLYELSRSSLLLDLHEPPGPQLCVLIQRIFDARAVAVFDMNLGRQDRVGDWRADEEHLAKECYLRGTARDDLQAQVSERILRAGTRLVGGLVVRGNFSPLVVDALAALAAIALNQHTSFENEDRAEKAKRSEELRAAVLDALAHELKTPLTAVQTASSGLLEFGGLTGRERELATLIDEGAGRLNELCTRLLLSARLDAEQVTLQKDEVNLRELVSELVTSRLTEVERDRVQVSMTDPALTVRVDGALLMLILAHLLDNALKYSAPSSPIEVAARMSSTEVLISVHNVGSIIRLEDRERIFDRFYRSPDLKEFVPGTGIGLSVVKKATESQHGHVWVISNASEGTTFYLSLPNGARRNP